MGWRVEREAQSAAGRTDLKLRRNGSEETVLVEVKVWGRNDYREAQGQIERYWTAGVSSGAVIQLTDARIEDWPERYRRECLASTELTVAADPPAEGSPISGHFAVEHRRRHGGDRRSLPAAPAAEVKPRTRPLLRAATPPRRWR